MRVLGVDCGSEATGYGLVESDGRRHRSLAIGTVRSNTKTPFPERLHRIHQTLTALMIEYRPDCVAIEDVFYARNVRSALKLGHVRGVVMQAAAALGIGVAEYAPLAVKSAVTGYGKAEKQQVLHMVKILLNLADDPDSLDASDALAVAICHIHHGTSVLGMATAQPGARRR